LEARKWAENAVSALEDKPGLVLEWADAKLTVATVLLAMHDHAAIACYLDVQGKLTRGTDPIRWGRLQHNMGGAYSTFYAAGHAAYFDRARTCFNSALQVRTKHERKLEWARSCISLARLLIDAPEQLEQSRREAIELLRDVAAEVDRETHPKEWALCQMSLGIYFAHSDEVVAIAEGMHYLYQSLPVLETNIDRTGAIACWRSVTGG
jgi:hypothetical protein